MSFYAEETVLHPQSESGPGCGVSLGVIRENWNADYPGMVQAELLDGEQGKNVTGWIPVAVLYGGNGYGSYALPEIGDLVVVAFVGGDRNRPIVIASLWSKVNLVPEGAAGEKNEVKLFRTKGGCQILCDDAEKKNRIQLCTPKGFRVELDDEGEKAVVSDGKGENAVILDGKNGQITVSAKSKLELTAGSGVSLLLDGSSGAITLKSGKIEVEAGQTLSVKGANTEISGSSVTLKGSGRVKLDSGGVLQASGAMIQLN